MAVDDGTQSLLNRVRKLEDAIKVHRAQKADDRCVEDDDRLYEALGDGIKCDRRVGNPADMLANCKRFIMQRCEAGGPWKTYAELEAAYSGLVERRPVAVIVVTDSEQRIMIQVDWSDGTKSSIYAEAVQFACIGYKMEVHGAPGQMNIMTGKAIPAGEEAAAKVLKAAGEHIGKRLAAMPKGANDGSTSAEKSPGDS